MNKIIRDALRAQLITLAASYRIAYDNVTFVPTVGELFLKEFFLPAEPFQIGTSYSDTMNNTGVYQLSIFSPVGGGMGETYTAIAAIDSAFYRGQNLGSVLTITKVFQGTTTSDELWSVTPISIFYKSAQT